MPATEFFADEPHLARSLDVLRRVGIGYPRLGQPATEISGGEAQRTTLATRLHTSRVHTFYRKRFRKMRRGITKNRHIAP